MIIEIEELQTTVKLGCSEEERSFPQVVSINLELTLQDPTSLTSDRLEDTVDYMYVIHTVEKVCQEQQFSLLEHLVNTLGTEILALSPKLVSVRVRTTKRISPVTKGISFTAEVTS